MKTHDSLHTTIGNPILFRRAAAALFALIVLLSGIGLARLAQPVAQAPLASSSAPINSASAHEGSAYVEYLSPRTPIETAPVAMPNPNTPISGIGSAYDGGSYGAAPATQGRLSYDSGANAEYVEYLTGRPLRGPAPTSITPNPNTPISGTGSAYDGGS